MVLRTVFVLLFLSLLGSSTLAATGAAPEQKALQGLKSARVIFDVRVADQERMVFNLQLVRETLDGIQRQKVKPVMVVTFRGAGVRLLTKAGADSEVNELLAELKGRGVRFEVCAVAMKTFKVEAGPLVPGVILVDNVLTSLIGYQNKGFAVITLS